MYHKAVLAAVAAVACVLPFIFWPSKQLYMGFLCEVADPHKCQQQIFDPKIDVDGDVRDGFKISYLSIGGQRIRAPADGNPSLHGIALLQHIEQQRNTRNPLLRVYEQLLDLAETQQASWAHLQSVYGKVFRPLGSWRPSAMANAQVSGAVDALVQSPLADSDAAALALLADLTRDPAAAEPLHRHKKLLFCLASLLWDETEVGGNAAATLANLANSSAAALAAVALYSWTPTWTDASGREYPEIQEMRPLPQLLFDTLKLSGWRTAHGRAPEVYWHYLDLLALTTQVPKAQSWFVLKGAASALSNEFHFNADNAADTPEWNAAREQIARIVLANLCNVEQFPSRSCKDPSEQETGADGPKPEQWKEFWECQDKADKQVAEALERWHVELGKALEAWSQVSADKSPSDSVVTQVKEALQGVDAARKTLEIRKLSRDTKL